jgi:isopentenyldiphosphate isomerase
LGEELLEIVDERGQVVGLAPRAVIHGNPSLLHRVVHVLVVNSLGEMLLQKRSMNKDVAAGRWDTSVGGHVDPGEGLIEAARREMLEELGIGGGPLEFLYSYTHSNPYESELVHTYRCLHEGPFSFNPEEIDEVRFWAIEEIISATGSGALSDNFQREIRTYFGLLGA